jgi:hypothetical protein
MARSRQPADERSREASQFDRGVEATELGSSEDATSRLDSIARRAYDRFQRRGGEHGRDQEDWFEAERELNQEGKQ